MRSKLDLADEYCNGIKRNHPSWPSTFGYCCNGCKTMARGSGKCANCFEKELAKVVGEDLAHKFHSTVIDGQDCWGEIVEHLEEE